VGIAVGVGAGAWFDPHALNTTTVAEATRNGLNLIICKKDSFVNFVSFVVEN
jgi:hypothetical protein